jgi:1,4-alpha-glucan branching enzyme
MLKRTPLRNGRTTVTFALPLDEPAGVVSVVGDFNGWEPGRHQLVPRKNGYRSVSLTVPAGQHRFRYLATGGVWLDDEAADAVDGHGCTITV